MRAFSCASVACWRLYASGSAGVPLRELSVLSCQLSVGGIEGSDLSRLRQPSVSTLFPRCCNGLHSISGWHCWSAAMTECFVTPVFWLPNCCILNEGQFHMNRFLPSMTILVAV